MDVGQDPPTRNLTDVRRTGEKRYLSLLVLEDGRNLVRNRAPENMGRQFCPSFPFSAQPFPFIGREGGRTARCLVTTEKLFCFW